MSESDRENSGPTSHLRGKNAGGWLGWLRNAFAIPAESEFAVNEEERAVAERVCSLIVSRGLSTPALIFLESFRPLNFLGAQSLHFFAPFVATLADARAFERFTQLLERPGSVEYLCRLIEGGRKPESRV